MVNKMKKGQMKVQQMAFMLMAITLFFVFVGLFVLSIKFSSLKDSAETLEQKEALLVVSKLAASPEFSCGESYGGQKVSCVDADKLMGLIKYKEDYMDLWGVKSIEIRKLYPEESNVECSYANYPDCGIFKVFSKGDKSSDSSSFVSLCRKETMNAEQYDKCELAKIIVGS